MQSRPGDCPHRGRRPDVDEFGELDGRGIPGTRSFRSSTHGHTSSTTGYLATEAAASHDPGTELRAITVDDGGLHSASNGVDGTTRGTINPHQESSETSLLPYSDGATLTSVLNRVTSNTIRWCTPSIDYGSAQVANPYVSDVSISYESLGFPSEPSGIFKEIFDRAALAYGAERTIFSVNGTTGSNFVVLRSLSRQIPNLRILAQRNVHQSIVHACDDYGINLLFMPWRAHPEIQCFLPNSIEEIEDGLTKFKPHVLLLTNPTYEGISLDLVDVIQRVRRIDPKVVIFIEEAWGAHLHFSDRLPASAMAAGADISVQSTHKQGGSLQQGAMIHWNEARIDTERLMDSYRCLTTTSPSYILMASLDAARELMQSFGRVKVDHLLDIARDLAQGIEQIQGLCVVQAAALNSQKDCAYSIDGTKLLVNVSGTGCDGYDIARNLEISYGIILEAYSRDALLFLVPFRATSGDVDKTLSALADVVRLCQMTTNTGDVPRLPIPTASSRVLDVGEVSRLLSSQIETVSIDSAIGRISAEHITPYPPGIPITLKGEAFSEEIVQYYRGLMSHVNAHVSAHDKTLRTVRVVK